MDSARGRREIRPNRSRCSFCTKSLGRSRDDTLRRAGDGPGRWAGCSAAVPLSLKSTEGPLGSSKARKELEHVPGRVLLNWRRGLVQKFHPEGLLLLRSERVTGDLPPDEFLCAAHTARRAAGPPSSAPRKPPSSVCVCGRPRFLACAQQSPASRGCRCRPRGARPVRPASHVPGPPVSRGTGVPLRAQCLL